MQTSQCQMDPKVQVYSQTLQSLLFHAPEAPSSSMLQRPPVLFSSSTAPQPLVEASVVRVISGLLTVIFFGNVIPQTVPQ